MPKYIGHFKSRFLRLAGGVLALLFCALLPGCAHEEPPGQTQPKPQLKCYLVDAANGNAFAGDLLPRAKSTIVWNQGTFQSPTAAREMTVTFNGCTYTGVYKYSICPVGCSVTKDYYEPLDPETAEYYEFCVISGTDTLSYISFSVKSFFDELTQLEPVADPANTLGQLAEQWAAHFIDTEAYEMRLAHTSKLDSPEVWHYRYDFVRMVNGQESTDKLQILLTDRGTLANIGGGQLGWTAEKAGELAQLGEPDVQALLEQALDKEILLVEDQRYGITPGGQVVLLASCIVEVGPGTHASMTVMIQEES